MASGKADQHGQSTAHAEGLPPVNQLYGQKERGLVVEGEDHPKANPKDELPNPEAVIEELGIPNWRALEKKAVRRLDMTLMPCLWSLYLFNYLDRASLS